MPETPRRSIGFLSTPRIAPHLSFGRRHPLIGRLRARSRFDRASKLEAYNSQLSTPDSQLVARPPPRFVSKCFFTSSKLRVFKTWSFTNQPFRAEFTPART